MRLFRFNQLSLNNLTIRQQLKLSNQSLDAALKRERDKDAFISILEGQLDRRDQHMGSLQQLVTDLSEQSNSKGKVISQLESQIILLERNGITLSEKISQQEAIMAEMQQVISADKKLLTRQAKELEKIDSLRHARKVLSRELYGRKSERMRRNAMIRDGLQAMDLSEDELTAAHAMYLKEGHVNIIREEIPGIREQGLPVKTIHKKPDNLPEGARFIGHNTNYQLVYHKAWTELHETIHHIYLVDDKENIVCKNISGKLDPRPMKCKADISVLVQLLMDKYQYHLPIYRQLSKFAQAGVRLKESTVYDWSNKTIRLLQPIYELMLREAIKGGILHCDETGLLVIDKSKELGKKSSRSQMWVMANPIQDFVVFQYAPGRGHNDISNVLGNFKGYLHTDGYTTYNKFGNRSDVQHGRCLTHCRRYFFLARDTHQKLADYALVRFFRPLYAIEAVCKKQNLNYDQIAEVRQEHAVPILQEFHKWMLLQQQKVKPNTPIARAIKYTLRLWDGIMLYTTEGFLQIDNNLAERLIRDLAVGKKNWLFAGSHQAAPNAAIMYTFLGTCKLQGIDPEAWLTDVLSRIKQTPAGKMTDLLPQHWKHQCQGAIA